MLNSVGASTQPSFTPFVTGTGSEHYHCRPVQAWRHGTAAP